MLTTIAFTVKIIPNQTQTLKNLSMRGEFLADNIKYLVNWMMKETENGIKKKVGRNLQAK